MNSIIRSYADSLAGCSEQEVKALMAEAEYVSLLLEGKGDCQRASELQPRVDPDLKLRETMLASVKA